MAHALIPSTRRPTLRKLNTYFEQVPLEAVRAAIGGAAAAERKKQDANVVFEPSSAKTEPYSVQESSRPRPRRRVLLVDPDIATRSTQAEHLRRLTYDVEEAGDGFEALAKAVANQPAIVVTESALTGISGAELCLMLRSEPLTRTVPVIVLAASAGTGRSSARMARADAVLVKPFRPDDLASEIRTLLAAATTREHDTTTDE